VITPLTYLLDLLKANEPKNVLQAQSIWDSYNLTNWSINIYSYCQCIFLSRCQSSVLCITAIHNYYVFYLRKVLINHSLKIYSLRDGEHTFYMHPIYQDEICGSSHTSIDVHYCCTTSCYLKNWITTKLLRFISVMC